METKRSMYTMWESMCNNGDLESKCSFLAATVDCDSFGEMRVPEAFHNRFSESLPRHLGLKCQQYIWPARYDNESKKICGLGTFMRYYALKVYSLAQFDYYGEGIFEVKLFRETAIECSYPRIHPNEFKKIKHQTVFQEDEYILDIESLEFEKRFSLFCFNACSNKMDFVEMRLPSLNLKKKEASLILDTSWEKFYNKWENGSMVMLTLSRSKWEVQVRWVDNQCMFCKGWLQFVKETGLEAGDYLLLHKDKREEDQTLSVCIFKGDDGYSDGSDGELNMEHSFFKMVYRGADQEGYFVLPRLFNKKFWRRVSRSHQITVGGRKWLISYNVPNGYIYNLKDMLKFYEVEEKEAVIFSIDEKNRMSGRIYQIDGMEINYDNRVNSDRNCGTEIWFLKPNFMASNDSDYEKENSAGLEDEDVAGGEHFDEAMDFFITVTAGHVDKKTHGPFIPVNIHPRNHSWTHGDEVHVRTEKGSWKLGIVCNEKRVRLSSGWNKFARENEYEVNDVLHWRLSEEHEGYVFSVATVDAD